MMDLSVIKTPQSWVIVVLGIALYVCRKIWQGRSKRPAPRLTVDQKPRLEDAENAYYQIEPLPNLNLENEEPIKLRTFKPKYHLTMAIETVTLSDLIAMDKTYSSRIALRRSLIRDHQHDVLAYNSRGGPAVQELYSWLITTYLPIRYPTVYTPTLTGLLNTVTGEILSHNPTGIEEALKILGGNIDTDLLLLLPIEEEGEDQGKYRLEAFITCFPSGFNTRSKLDLKLADIHTPVPGYAAKLEKSMDRFFASLPLGKIVRRHNWSITTNPQLFALSGNHIHDEEQASDLEAEKAKVDLAKTVLRCERQTLHRLPKTRALLFAFKTYTYPIQELRDEGNGEDLALAIDGLGEGNVPGMTVYKRQVVWGEKVKRFLRGEIGVDG